MRENLRFGPSFSLGNRLARLAWGLCAATVFRFSPRPCHFIRSGLLRLFGAKIGKSCHFYPGAVIWAPWNLVVGDNVGVADEAVLYSMAKITIGDRAVISQGAYLCCGTHDYTRRNFQLMVEPIAIGADAWIAARAFLHPGVTVGDGTVVGACSVVTRNIPAWTVATGNPCREIRKRIFND